MKPRVSPFVRTIVAALCPFSAFAANTTYTLGGAISSATDWSTASWSPSNPGAGAAGDIILRSADSNANSLNLNVNFTTGSIRFTSPGARTFQINASGSNAITFDGTGITGANNSFSNAGTASIVAASAGGVMNIRPHIILTNTNLDVGIGTGATNTPTISLGDTTANTTSITNADSTDRNLNFRINVSGNVNVTSTIGAATGSGGATGTGKINISNLGGANGTVAISGNLTTGVGSVTQNSANSRLSLSGTNTYAGNYTISNGALAFITRTSLYNADTSQWTAAKINVASGGILGLGYGDSTKFTATEIQSLNNGNILVAGSSLGIDVSDTRVYSNVIANSNSGANSIGFAKLGAGTLGLNAANTYTGTTTLFQGNLRLDAAQGASSGPLGANSGSIYFNGGTLQFTAANTYDYSGRFSTATNQNIRIDTNGQNVTFASVIAGATNQITKSGTGTLILTADNTYGAAGNVFTTVSTGTVRGADPTVYTTATANLRKVFGAGAVQLGGGTTLELRANGQNDSSVQTLNYGNQIQVSSSNATYNINVDQESATGGTNKIISMGTHNVGANAVMNLTGGNGFSLRITNYAPGGGTGASSTLLNPVGANLIIDTIGGGSNQVNPTVGLGGTSTGNRVDGVIANNTVVATTVTSIAKSNTGSWTLGGANTYTGTTTVSGGTLYINGSTSAASGNVTVNTGGTLGGNGTLFGTNATASTSGVIVNGGTINPGTLNSSVGHLRVASISTTGALNFAAGGTYFWDLAAFADNSDGVAGTDFDQIELTGSGGNLVLGGTSALTLAFGNAITSPDSADPFWQAARSWTIVKGGASTTNTGSTNFASITNGTYASGSFTTTSDALGNVILNFTPIPEPSTALIAALGGLAVLRRRRR